MILATDMASHSGHLEAIAQKIVNKKVTKEKQNSHLLIESAKETEVFKNQQDILEFLLHSCDFAPSTRKFETLHNWTYLLFEEFFNQGDVERHNGKEIAFLCDRATINVAQQQPGFMNFIVIPTWKVVATILPDIEEAYMRVEQNAVQWTTYQENDEDRKVYLKKQKKLSILHGVSDINWTVLRKEKSQQPDLSKPTQPIQENE